MSRVSESICLRDLGFVDVVFAQVVHGFDRQNDKCWFDPGSQIWVVTGYPELGTITVLDNLMLRVECMNCACLESKVAS